MTGKDKDIWSAYAAGLVPVKARKPKLRTEKPVVDKREARKAAQKTPLTLAKIASAPQAVSVVPETLERRREKAFRDGDIEIEATLDLHGMTQLQAFDSLAAFMEKRTNAGKRHFLIITGKGRGEKGGKGVLHTSLPQWLRQLPQSKSILAIRPAAPRHGGDGAFYVLMRRR